MAKQQPVDEILSLEDSITFIRGNFKALYPSTSLDRKTIGNIPEGLMDKLRALADQHNLKFFELLAAMVDFMAEYEELYAEELKAQRALPLKRR
jgi:hypothetical protein